MKKRMLTMLLALVMIMCVLPFTAMAAEEECAHSEKTHIEKEDATCIHQGVIYIVCETCGEHIIDKLLDFGPHTYGNDNKCDVCGNLCKHKNYGTPVTVEATCTEAGSVTKTCTECGYKSVKTLKASGHKFNRSVIGRVATCTVDGYEKHTECSVCGEKDDDYIVIKALGHDIETITDTAATCTKNGKLVQECKNEGCEFAVTETRKKLGHDYADMAAQAPTCTEAGYSAYQKCNNCGKVKNKKPIDATGHTYVNGQCACGAVASDYAGPEEPNPECEHPSKSTYKTSADCTVVGYIVVTCDDCHVEISREIIPATGHTETTITRTPTCTENGFERVVCEVCGTRISNTVLEHFGHDYENGICINCGSADSKKYSADFQDVFIVG